MLASVAMQCTVEGDQCSLKLPCVGQQEAIPNSLRCLLCGERLSDIHGRRHRGCAVRMDSTRGSSSQRSYTPHALRSVRV